MFCKDKIISEGYHFGFHWIVSRGEYKNKIGFINVSVEHPWYRKSHESIRDINGNLVRFDGGLHYSFTGWDNEFSRPNYWIGFLCLKEEESNDFIEDECRSLCEQAWAVAQYARPDKPAASSHEICFAIHGEPSLDDDLFDRLYEAKIGENLFVSQRNGILHLEAEVVADSREVAVRAALRKIRLAKIGGLVRLIEPKSRE